MEKIGVLMVFLFLGLSVDAQSEYFRKGASGFNLIGEYAQARDSRNRMEHAVGINWGYGWGGKGEIGFGLAIIDSRVGQSYHAGYNLIPKVKEYGIKLESDFVKNPGRKWDWVPGVTLFGNIGESNLFVPSLSLYRIGDDFLSQLTLRAALGAGVIKFTPSISVGIVDENQIYSLGLGIMSKMDKKKVPTEM